MSRVSLLILFALGAVGLLAAQTAGASVPTCRGQVTVSTFEPNAGSFLESILVGGQGRVYVSLVPDAPDNDRVLLVRYDRPGSTPVVIAESFEGTPGGLAWDGKRILWGSIRGGQGADEDPRSAIYLVDTNRGIVDTFATGLGQANGIARARDGVTYASNNLGLLLDRIGPTGSVNHSWGTVESANGLVVSSDQKYLFAAQTFVDPGAVVRIDRSRPSRVITWWSAAGLDPKPFLDGITRDDLGNLYVTSFIRGEIIKIDRRRRACVVASGINSPTSLNFGFRNRLRSGRLFVSSYSGAITSITGAQKASVPG